MAAKKRGSKPVFTADVSIAVANRVRVASKAARRAKPSATGLAWLRLLDTADQVSSEYDKLAANGRTTVTRLAKLCDAFEADLAVIGVDVKNWTVAQKLAFVTQAVRRRFKSDERGRARSNPSSA